ncbi:SHQ1 protein [Oesophagostomum dentatum]|uniref:Protein SHQ1 homolog n=1 Tax=Oesophagostomum dentatum TaxID=61180 RepID=A0A0B1T2U1_OESDE|nr:SHQ1 protein [Oesophagostomum dentatum]
MITPSFSIAQDNKQLIFTIRAPYAKIAETEIEYADDIFMFSSPPYHLSDSIQMTLIVEAEDGSEYLNEQKVIDVSAGCSDDSTDSFGYGFAWRRKGVLGQLSKEIGDLVELPDPESTAIMPFSSLDFLEPEENLQLAIRSEFGLQLDIDADDRKRLKDFPKKKLPRLSQEDHHLVALSLVDLVFAFAYDSRINDWEMCCETGWNITKLAPSLTYLCQWKNATEAFTGAVRRSLCYPLFRNWDLSMKVVDDTKYVIQKGRAAILHVLCKIHEVMIGSGEFRYLYNDLFITDYCLWIQSVDDAVVEQLQKEVADVKVSKSDLGLDLEELELEGRMAAMKMKEPRQLDSDDESD